MSADADLVIAGAGAAGLGALWHVLHGPAADRRIVVVDRDLGPRDERTWGFWGPDSLPFADLADRSWDRVAVRFPQWRSVQPLEPGRRYHRVRERDLRDRVLDLARSRRSTVCLVEGHVTHVEDRSDGAVVGIDGVGEIRTPLVLGSVPRPGDRPGPNRQGLRQHFAGWEVRTERPIFDPDAITLMDFDTEQFGSCAFFYVLPTSETTALVEHTMFDQTTASDAFHGRRITDYLEREGAGRYEVERRESGVIPMVADRPPQRRGRHVWNVGTAGGMTKPTTGYTFQRSQRQVRHLLDAWAGGRPLTELESAPRRFAAADRVLLRILRERPTHGRRIFDRLFATTPIDQVLTFLDEDSELRADAKMLAGLPWGPFMRAAVGEASAMVSGGTGAR